jgi:luciferase family oxidoreductase group 1
MRLSVLDLSPVLAGSTGSQALHATIDLARRVDGLGYSRYWLAEHHNLPPVASSAPEVLIGHVASVTSAMRVGAGGIMLPNHAPLRVAETFRVLEALHPGRIDLGLGRAPGTDPLTALALRRWTAAGPHEFPSQLEELLGFLQGNLAETHPAAGVTAVPTDVAMPEIWLLGTTTLSADFAARLGLAFAYAHHIEPDEAIAALRVYRERFVPSPLLAQPRSMVALAAICGEDEEHGQLLATSYDLTWLWLRQNRAAPIPSVEDARNYKYSMMERGLMRGIRTRRFAGSVEHVREQILELAEAAAVDEVMINTIVHDHEERCRSYERLAACFELGGGVAAQAVRV